MASGNGDFSPVLGDHVIGCDNIRIGNQIGRGANGRILEGKWEGISVAVKEIHSVLVNEVSDQEFQCFKRNFLRECEQCSRFHHPNIVRFFGIYHPPGARVPSLVMERLHCSLTSLLEENPVVPIETKLSIIKDVSLGLRYLHTRNPPIIHRDLSSNNVLLSKGMEGKIGDLGTARLVDPRKQSRMTKAPGTAHFMPPEALEDDTSICYGEELDVYSFGCVMLHTLSHEWPTPSQAVIINPETGLATGGRTEVERRSKYFERIDGSRSDVLVPLIESCLSNLPKNRPSIVKVCDRLEGHPVDRESVATNESVISTMQQEIHQKNAELKRKDIEIETNFYEIQQKDAEIQSKYDEIQRKNVEIQQLTALLHDKDCEIQGKIAEIQKNYSEIEEKNDEIKHLTTSLQGKNLDQSSKEVNKSSIEFWNSLNLLWEPCAYLPLTSKCWGTSVAALDDKVYATELESGCAYVDPLMYDSIEDKWSLLPALPYAHFSLVTVPDRKQLLAIGGVVNNNGVYEVSNKVFLWDEKNRKWTTPYPYMHTARCQCSSISHGSAVIVAGGVTCRDPWTMTRTVEVLHIKEDGWFTGGSYWCVVEQLPHVVYDAIPLTVDNQLYLALGSDKCNGHTTCNIVTASLPELLQSGNKNTSGSQVWNKLPDMPYSSPSINHYQGRLIAFSGRYRVEQHNADKPVWQSVQLIHIYNPDTKTWDCVGETPHGYLLGRSVHIKENKILFVGGLTGACDLRDEDLIKNCSVLTLSPW